MMRTVGWVIAALLAVAVPAYLFTPGNPPVANFDEGHYDIVPADAVSGCAGNLALPVGASVGDTDTISSGSDDVRFSAFVSDAGAPASIGVATATDAVAATTIERVGSGDLAGLGAFSCSEPQTETWLLGGSTALGESSRLVLANPSPTPTNVEITVYGPAGPIDPPITRALAAESSDSLLLEGIAPDLGSMAVHVAADAGGVVAAIQDSRLDGFLPVGTDWVHPSDPPATSMVVPGIGPSDPEGIDGPAVVRLFSPEGGFISMRLVSTAGEVLLAGVGGVTLEPGEVIEVDLPASAVGTLLVEATSPTLAAVRSSVGREPDEGLEGDVARDFAWVNGQSAESTRSVAVTTHYSVTVAAYATADTTMRVFRWGTDELLMERVLAEGETIEAPLRVDAGTPVMVEGDVVWVLRVADEPGYVTTVEPIDPDDEARPVTVRPGPYVP